MLTSKASASFEASMEAGIADVDERIATDLGRCSLHARGVWALIYTVSRTSLPEGALWERTGREEQTRAALVELLTFKLVGYDGPGSASLSHCGVWGPRVTALLGGEPGGAVYPNWDIPSHWTLVSSGVLR